MLRSYRLFVAICIAAGLSTAAVGQFSLPRPEVFARAEDRQRARSINKPCVKADAGHGCFRFNGKLRRAPPCSYQIEPGVMASLPTDQCYRMERPRRYRGVWVDEFEGQTFIPEGAKAPKWKGERERAIAATIWLDVESANIGHKWQQGGRRVFIEFIGRKTRFPGKYGHLGIAGQYIVVDRVISLRECPKAGACS